MVQAPAGMEIIGAMRTDTGLVRTLNEDSVVWVTPHHEDAAHHRGSLALVADGMGGHAAGEVASALAADVIRRLYYDLDGAIPQVLANAFTAANRAILEYAAEHPECRGMGTTCTALAIVGSHLYFAHVGDSRLYLVRGARILRLTRDHSYVGRLVESGIVRAEDAEKHPQRHILTAALGAGRELAVDGADQILILQEGDDLLLCTDGLWSVVTEEELENAVSGNPPAECCAALVKLARQRGAPDNITLQVLRVGAESQA